MIVITFPSQTFDEAYSVSVLHAVYFALGGAVDQHFHVLMVKLADREATKQRFECNYSLLLRRCSVCRPKYVCIVIFVILIVIMKFYSAAIDN